MIPSCIQSPLAQLTQFGMGVEVRQGTAIEKKIFFPFRPSLFLHFLINLIATQKPIIIHRLFFIDRH